MGLLLAFSRTNVEFCLVSTEGLRNPIPSALAKANVLAYTLPKAYAPLCLRPLKGLPTPLPGPYNRPMHSLFLGRSMPAGDILFFALETGVSRLQQHQPWLHKPSGPEPGRSRAGAVPETEPEPEPEKEPETTGRRRSRRRAGAGPEPEMGRSRAGAGPEPESRRRKKAIVGGNHKWPGLSLNLHLPGL